MKKALSIILLVSMLMSMLLIPSVAAEQADPEFAYRTNVMRGPRVNATLPYFTAFTNRSGSGKPMDGYRGFHTPDNSDKSAYVLGFKKITAHYDINDKKVDDGKYVGSVTYKFSADHGNNPAIEIIRIYFDWINIGGTAYSPYLVNGFDVAISETAEDDSWDIVYSVTDFADGKKYQSHYTPENGRENAYVEIKLDKPTKANYIRFAVTDMDNKTANANQRYTIHITELEVWTEKQLDTTYRENAALGATVPESPLGLPAAIFSPELGNQNNATDGQRTYYSAGETSGDHIALDYKVAEFILNNRFFNIDGSGDTKPNDSGDVYEGYVTFQLQSLSEIEVIRLYTGTQLTDGTYFNYQGNGFDIAVSETGEAGSWRIVYSGKQLADKDLYMIEETEDGQRTPYIEAWFEPTEAKFIRVAFTDTDSKFAETDSERACIHINEIEAWTVEDFSAPSEEPAEEPETGINSLMLFPLLMRHRQYETETTTTMFGLRVKHLLRSADSITFEKNGIKVDIPAATLKALNLAGSDKLVVTIDGTDAENAKVTVTVNGEAVDIEGIASSTPEEPEVKGTTYRWDFNDLNEANGLNNLTDSAQSTKNYKFEDGMIVIDDRTTDFKMAETISLSPYTDWSIEWKAQLNNASALFGTESSKQNFVYIAYTVSGWGLPFRMVDANNKALMIKQGDYAPLNTEMNTWKAEYSSAENRLTLKFFNVDSQEWEVVGAGSPPDFSFELTHMFGRYGDPATTVNLCGKVDYVEVFIGE